MVICVADDAGMHSSQNEQDSRHYAEAAKLPMLEPSNSSEALAFAKAAYEISETFDTPVIIKMCTRVAHSQSVVETGEREERPTKPYEKNIQKNVMMPANAKKRHYDVEKRMKALEEYAETTPSTASNGAPKSSASSPPPRPISTRRKSSATASAS